ncbi:MAG: hypothetical protein LKJ88_08025 [Bacilli bacterium]|jgi:hypothetical protein|nr:hypothetical protein [Bacilli bacterium]
MASLAERQKKDRIKETVAYSFCGLIWLGGLVLCVLGVIAFNGPGKITYNDLYNAQKAFSKTMGWSKMADFRIMGAVICLIAMCFFLAFINHFANRYEKDAARRSVQEARLHQLLEEDRVKEEKAIAEAKANQVALPKEVPSSAPVPPKAEADKGPLPPAEKKAE